jgi:hypothetical protein
MARGNIQGRNNFTPVYQNYQDLFQDGAAYVFDGNRVVARFRVGSNGVGWWRLQTIDPDVSLSVGRDLRLRVYARIGQTTNVRLVRLFETVFDALKPLDEAIRDCEKHGHVWSTGPMSTADEEGGFVWCVLCGDERTQSCGQNGPPSDANGNLPSRLHGPLFSDRERSRGVLPDENRKEGATSHQALRAMTLGAMFSRGYLCLRE